MSCYKYVIIVALFLFSVHLGKADDGYRLWLRYVPVENATLIQEYQMQFSSVAVSGESETVNAIRNELTMGLSKLLDKEINISSTYKDDGLIIGTPNTSTEILGLGISDKLNQLGNEGYLISEKRIKGRKTIVIASKTEIGALYGTFHFLRLIQTQQVFEGISLEESPKTTHRLLNHWDNLDRTVERGYAGFSIWDWHKLPNYIDQRYIDYARANTSIGINGVVLNNVNANALILTPEYLLKIKALADLFRAYGIKVYLTARFSAPVELDGLKTADPLDANVVAWWKTKANEIYTLIPDFGGFLVKANSEGQPGPQNYGRNHADGANMLSNAIAPFGGVVMWRAFVYDNNVPDDRAKQAYNEFKPLDQQFADNIFVQVKNGAIDFQPREPFHPLFGAMEHTPVMMEFQITQEYLGCATNLVFLAPLFKECLESDTYAKGVGSTVGKVIDGSLYHHQISGMAGVANIGNDRNWTGHPFGQANWYAFGRLAWNHEITSEQIAEEWLRMTFTNNMQFLKVVKPMMLNSRETAVNYMTPLGLHHQMAWNHHWGPGPWVNIGRPDWTSLYYHRADSIGLGFNRSESGSNAVAQYSNEVRNLFNNLATCPEKNLLWFHHVPWDYRMKSGQTLWNELCERYYTGSSSVMQMQKDWKIVEKYVDPEQFNQVDQLLQIQANESVWWRNAMLLYFQTFSGKPIPAKYEQPDKTLDYYKNLKFHFVPGIKSAE